MLENAIAIAPSTAQARTLRSLESRAIRPSVGRPHPQPCGRYATTQPEDPSMPVTANTYPPAIATPPHDGPPSGRCARATPVPASRAVSTPSMSLEYTTPFATDTGPKCSGPPSLETHASRPSVPRPQISPAGGFGP